MKEKNMFWVSGFSGAVGGCLGAVCGSGSLAVVVAVGGVMGFLVAWLISGFLK